MMIKYLGPREFSCAVITASGGPFSLCLRGHLCLFSAKPRLKRFQLLMQKGRSVDLELSEARGGAGRGGPPARSVPTVSRAGSAQQQRSRTGI